MADVRLNRILCPVTFSASSRGVIDWAASLAALSDAEVRLFHVVERGGLSSASDVEGDEERVLNKLFALARHVTGRVRLSAAVARGSAADEILQHAGVLQADLVAVGLTTRAGMVSPLVHRIAIDARCPVLAVPDRSGAPRGSDERPVGQLVCAVNFLPASLAAADYAFALGRKVGAPVTIVHVVPERWHGPERQDSVVDEMRALAEGHFRHLLHVAVRDASGSAHGASEVVVSGWPCVEIVRLAHIRAADLIVMGIDREPEGGQPFGGTTGCVLEFARCPVLLVPPRLYLTSRNGRAEGSTAA
jgi:nucleotide-binding universal stress UspA family protein